MREKIKLVSSAGTGHFYIYIVYQYVSDIIIEFGDRKCQKFVKLQKKQLCQATMYRMPRIELAGFLSQIFIIIDYGLKFKING
jgi:hypothetical protein